MSWKEGSMHVRGIPAADAPQALQDAAAHAPGDAGTQFLVASEPVGEWLGVQVLDDYGSVACWGQAVSLHRSTTVVTIFVFEGSWNYDVFDRGRHVFGMHVWNEVFPTLRGDAAEAARLIGCEASILIRYYEAIVAACRGDDDDDDDDDWDELSEGEQEALKAYPDDRFMAAEEFGYIDFSRRAGLGDPDYLDPPLTVTVAAPRAGHWTGLPPLLS